MDMAVPDGFVDLQVNGYFGVDFNADDLSAEALHKACARLRADGNAGILATVITDELDVMCSRLQRLVRLRAADDLISDLIWGIHIEGPFINELPGYVGAHPPAAVRPADVDATERLLAAADGLTRIVTLAPERDPGLEVTRFLAAQGITVSAGHCNPSLNQLEAAIQAGLSMFTHLGNGCPMLLDRHDNIIQRVLSLAHSLWLCFIADNVHVPCVALANYLNIAGINRCIVVTDAIAAAGLGPGRYSLGSQAVVVDDKLVARIPGDDTHLAGSAVTMPRSADNLRNVLGLAAADIDSLTSLKARQLLRR